MATPNPVDFYSRYMVEMFDQRAAFPSAHAFLSFFGNPVSPAKTHFSQDEKSVDIDIIKGNGRRLAATVHRGQSSNAIDSKNTTDYEFTNISRKWPLIEEVDNINSTQLLNRLPGDNPYERRTQMDRNRALALDLHTDQVRKTIRTWEYFAREAVLTGKHPAIIGTTNNALIYDFYRLPSHTIGVPAPWDTGTPDILGDIDKALTLVENDSGRIPDFLALGGSALNAFIKDTTVKALADIKNYELIRVGDNFQPPTQYSRYTNNGWTAIAQLITPLGRRVWIFTNSRTFTNNAGTSEYWMPLDKAFLLNTEARFDRYFGPRDRMPVTPVEAQWYMQNFGFSMMAPPMPPEITNIGSIIMPQAFFFDAYTPEDKKTTVMRMQSAPIFPTTETDAIAVLTDLITP